eukprot:38144_1
MAIIERLCASNKDNMIRYTWILSLLICLSCCFSQSPPLTQKLISSYSSLVSLPFHDININKYNINMKQHNMNINISATLPSLHPNNFTPIFGLNILNNSSTISVIFIWLQYIMV